MILFDFYKSSRARTDSFGSKMNILNIHI